ncbi:MAG: glycosyltransferase family 4 protein [Tannerellaceae bacterium]|nr:glycosyltransferase family 4 protein [Tannerellaceae bacterium]
MCLSNYMKDVLCRYYGLDKIKISVIPNGLSDFLNTSINRKFLRKKWNIHPQEKIILFAGRMDEMKGLSYLVKAFKRILIAFPQSRLVIAGTGDFNKYLQEGQDVCTRITYTGLLEKKQLYEWHSLSDIGVAPSLFEPFGFVAVEMMMQCLPIVATNTSGLNEVIDDTCALKIPLTKYPDKVNIDMDLLAEKIIYLLQNPEKARILGKNGRKRYEKMYTSDVFGQKMLRFYHSLIE